jgi:hypothetical protein
MRRSSFAEFGLKHDDDIAALGDAKVTIEVDFSRDYWLDTDSDFVELPPPERRKALEQRFKSTYEHLVDELPLTHVKLGKRRHRYQSFTCTLPASALLKLFEQPDFFMVTVLAVEGRKKRKILASRKRMEWYAVHARFAIQLEDQTKGIQEYEDRILLVKATDFDDAVARLEKEFEDYARPHLNGNCEMLRSKFEKVLDVYRTYIDKLDPNGTEAFSTFGSRRMRPEYEWHPRETSKST